MHSTLYENSSDEDLQEGSNSQSTDYIGDEAGKAVEAAIADTERNDSDGDKDKDEVPATTKLSNLTEEESMDDSSEDGNSTYITTFNADNFPSVSLTSLDGNSTEAPSTVLEAILSDPLFPDFYSDDTNSTDAPSTIEEPLDAILSDPVFSDAFDDVSSNTKAPVIVDDAVVVQNSDVPTNTSATNGIDGRMEGNGKEESTTTTTTDTNLTNDSSAATIISSKIPCLFGIVIATLFF